MSTYQEYIASRKHVDNLAHYVDYYGEDTCGFIYFDSYWIAEPNPEEFYTLVSNEDILTKSLTEAEDFLWNNFVKGEQHS